MTGWDGWAALQIDRTARAGASKEIRALMDEREARAAEGSWTALHQAHYERRIIACINTLANPPPLVQPR